jgi:hypothetical protein
LKILITAVDFFPDNSSVAQHLYDLSIFLNSKGYTIDVISSIYSYENKFIKYNKFDIINNIKIFRVSYFKFGKKNSIILRIFDIFFFYFSFFIHLFFKNNNKYDYVLCTTSPPMFAFFISLYCKIRKFKLCYWVMDLQPELSIEANLIKRNSLISKFFLQLNKYTIQSSHKIITLDKYMTNYLCSLGCSPSKIITSPVWPILHNFSNTIKNENPFAIKNGFLDKIIIMYSGNHSVVHPLDTILEVTLYFKNDPRFLFVFIGSGVRVEDVKIYKYQHKLNNILQLPYQSRNDISFSLSSADIHLVVMGDNLVGFTHPNKIYGALYVGKPVVYIGPSNSHVTDILDNLYGNIVIKARDVNLLIEKLEDFTKLSDFEKNIIGLRNRNYVLENFNSDMLKQNMLNLFQN